MRFCSLELFFNSPARPFDVHQFLRGCAFRAPCRKIGEVPVSNVPADQQATCPWSGSGTIKLRSIKFGKRELGPVIELLTPCTAAC